MTEDKRLKLSEELHALGTKNVYYQPPSGTKIKYPCIIYQEEPEDERFADDKAYISHQVWNVTIIGTYSDRVKVYEIIESFKGHFKYRRHDQHFISENLIHDVFTLTY